MPHIVVYGLMVSDFSDEKIAAMEKAVTEACLSVPGLKLTKDDVSFSFVSNSSVTTEDVPIIIIVELLFDKPERTEKVRNHLAALIGKNFTLAILNWRKVTKVEVAVKKFKRSDNGFWYYHHGYSL